MTSIASVIWKPGNVATVAGKADQHDLARIIAAYPGKFVGFGTIGFGNPQRAIAAVVLVWRLNVELRHGQAIAERAERRAAHIGGALLFALATYVVAHAA